MYNKCILSCWKACVGECGAVEQIWKDQLASLLRMAMSAFILPCPKPTHDTVHKLIYHCTSRPEIMNTNYPFLFRNDPASNPLPYKVSMHDCNEPFGGT